MELSSSSDEEIVSITNRENSTTGHDPGRTSTPDAQCSICLGDLINKCHTNTCGHLFCFVCLKRWSNTKSSCPLCKEDFNRIYHTFTEQGRHETYDVYQQVPQITIRSYDIFNLQNWINGNFDTPFFDRNASHTNSATPMTGQASRIQVYFENTWADPLPDSNGHYRECSSAFYRNDPAQTHRLHDFILRDLIAVREATRMEGGASAIFDSDDVCITNWIMRSILFYELRESFMVNILQPFLAEHTRHFFHELYNYANSPYDMIDYDRHVQYNFRNSIDMPLFSAIEHLIDLNSFPSSDLQLRSGPIPEPGPIINETSSLTDQPSTSTGIRDSLDRPNNRRQRISLTVNKYSSIPEHTSQIAPGVSRASPISDSLSGDEESTSTFQTRACLKSQDVDYKNKIKQKNNNNKKEDKLP